MQWEFIALFATLALMLGGVVWGMFFTRDSKIHRALVATPIRSVAGARPGETIRLTGRVEAAGETLTAPLSRRTCVHYRMVLEEHLRQGVSNVHRWEPIHTDERAVEFLLRDDSGLARVRMTAAAVAVVVDRNSRSGLLDDPTRLEAALLERLGEQPTGFAAMNRSLRYKEGAIEVGETVTVLGVAAPGDAACRVTIDAPPGGQVLVTDEPTTVRTAPRS